MRAYRGAFSSSNFAISFSIIYEIKNIPKNTAPNGRRTASKGMILMVLKSRKPPKTDMIIETAKRTLVFIVIIFVMPPDENPVGLVKTTIDEDLKSHSTSFAVFPTFFADSKSTEQPLSCLIKGLATLN